MIRSTFAGFTTAQLAMSASQRALDVTGQNIANINTVGYTRQRLDIASLHTHGTGFFSSSKDKVGYGVEITGISQLRDPFLDMQYRSQVGKVGTTDSHVAGFEQLEAIFDESSMDGIRTALSSITSSLTTLSEQKGDKDYATYDTMVRSNMQILLNLFRDNSTRLEGVREDLTNGFKTTDVDEVNQILKNISDLNSSIKNAQVLGNPALELQDQRNDLLDQLGGYLPISVKYRDKEVCPGQTIEVLDVFFTDTKGGKHTLISDDLYASFDTDISGEPVTLTLSDASGVYDVDVTDTLGDGSLKGTLDMLNKSGDFDNSDFKGLGYYEKALDSLASTFVQKFNEMNKAPILDAAGKITGYENRPLFEQIDTSKGWTASNIKIADNWTNGTYRITASKNPINGEIPSGANENILAMIKSLSDEHSFTVNGTTFYKGSFYNCYANIENNLGIDKKSSETLLKNQISVLNQTANSRDGVSGVQLDEEGMNLMHYNQSYTAAARLMTTLDEALDTLINKTGVVGR